MQFLCEVCDRSIIEDQCEYKEYLSTLRRENHESLYKNYFIMNPRFHEVDKILIDYITTHSRKLDFYFIISEFKIEFDNNFTTNKETNYFYHIDITNIMRYLLYYID